MYIAALLPCPQYAWDDPYLLGLSIPHPTQCLKLGTAPPTCCCRVASLPLSLGSTLGSSAPVLAAPGSCSSSSGAPPDPFSQVSQSLTLLTRPRAQRGRMGPEQMERTMCLVWPESPSVPVASYDICWASDVVKRTLCLLPH